jgi:hypothetical protein
MATSRLPFGRAYLETAGRLFQWWPARRAWKGKEWWAILSGVHGRSLPYFHVALRRSRVELCMSFVVTQILLILELILIIAIHFIVIS